MTTLSGPDLAVAAATAAARVLPATTPLTATGAQPGTADVAGLFAGAVVADLAGTGRVALLVGEELVNALAQSPLGGLDLGSATQPAVDALAGVLGMTAGPARRVDLGLVVADLGGPFTAVPLIGAAIDAAVLLPDSLLTAPAPPTPAFAAAPAAPADERPYVAPSVPDATAASPVTGASPGLGSSPVAVATRGIEMLHGVDLEVTVELGRARMTVRDLLALSPGAVLELDRAAGSPADLLVNGRLIARGEVVVIDEDFGLRITEILDDSQVG